MDEEEKEDIDIFTEERLESLTTVIGAKLFGNHFGLFLLNSDPWIEPDN